MTISARADLDRGEAERQLEQMTESDNPGEAAMGRYMQKVVPITMKWMEDEQKSFAGHSDAVVCQVAASIAVSLAATIVGSMFGRDSPAERAALMTFTAGLISDLLFASIETIGATPVPDRLRKKML